MSMTCYGLSSLDVVILPNYGPCNPQAGSISLCCEIGEICLTNGLCVTPSGDYYNGGCTDDTYQSENCPEYCTSGDANWVIQCPPDSGVKNGDFCCSVNGTASTCCNTPSNGLGLVAAEYSGEAFSISNEANTVPAYISSGAATSSFRSIASPTMSTTSPTDHHLDSPHVLRNNGGGVPIGLLIVVVIAIMAFALSFRLWFIVKWIKRRRGSRRNGRNTSLHRDCHAEADNSFAMYRLRNWRHDSGRPQPTAMGVVPIEAEGSQADPVETNASQTHLAAAGPSPARPSSAGPSPRDRRAGSDPSEPSSRVATSPIELEGSQADPVETDVIQTLLAAAGPSSARLSRARASSADPSTSRAPEGTPLAEPWPRARRTVSLGPELDPLYLWV